jgi:thioredoxin:protein disulfide reductase
LIFTRIGDPGVIRALERFRRVRADATRLDNEDTKNLIRFFKVYGVPTVIFLDETGREVEEMRVSGFISPKEFLGMMRETGLLLPSDSEMLTNS